jgi:glucosamine--fructose-6-phosphate aminotransferase (isomerizing)
LSDNVKKILKKSNKVEEIAKKYSKSKNFLYLGRGYNFPVALEGALKLKEISYIHAEGYPAAEMKHGPIALIDKNMPVVVVATKKGNYKKIVSNVMEIKARGGKVISIVTEGDKEIKKISDDFIEIPESQELISPILANIPLQLLSYYIADFKGCSIDQPRNLAKSVTVE